VVNFDYINAEGEYSSRRIIVRVLADTYFEGIDTEIHETRTFRYDRVVGLITSEETGEIIDPEAWATAARNPFANKPSQSTGRQLQKSVSIEICFTGFAKADKSNLEEMAESAGMIVRKSVTNGLTHLCAGPNAGPSKLSKAGEVGAEVIDEGEFYSLFAES
jgi:NAD-dependent DNA ligase